MSADQTPKKPSTDDAFSEFPAEPLQPQETPKDRDWFEEFPDEKDAGPRTPHAKNWMKLHDRVKNEKT